MSHDRTMVYVAIAYWDTEGRARVEIAAQRSGPDWLLPWLTVDRAKGQALTMSPSSDAVLPSRRCGRR